MTSEPWIQIPTHGIATRYEAVPETCDTDCGRFGGMPQPAKQAVVNGQRFDEKEFYLDEFRGRTLLLCMPIEELGARDLFEELAAIVRELLANDTRTLLLIGTPETHRSEPLLRRLQRRLGALIFQDDTLPLFADRRSRAAAFAEVDPCAFETPEGITAFVGSVWARLRRGPLYVGLVPGVTPPAMTLMAHRVGARLRVHKLVLVEAEGGINGADGKEISFMDEKMLEAVLGAGEAEWTGLASRRATLEAVRAALLGGVASVNLCSLAGLARELFTYTGSGTLFTLEDYCTVQPMGIDDFEEVERLIERGQREGLLKMRTPTEVAAMLANGYAATIGSHHLAGICALETARYRTARAGEIVGLYAITRFKGEGVGMRLIARVLAEARQRQLAYVFACTTEERAQVFFERQGFRRVTTADVPAAKWVAYDTHRKARVAVMRLDLEG
jgi:N-acetylglutamate synthase-like GNAT family acetyltransferase